MMSAKWTNLSSCTSRFTYLLVRRHNNRDVLFCFRFDMACLMCMLQFVKYCVI